MDNISRQELIKRASQAYYSDGSSPLTDAEFDALLEEERKENPNSPLLGVGHGYDVTLTSGQKFPHRYGIVGSLPKCHNWAEYSKSLKNVEVCKTLKLDGISCVMYYRNGTMYQALTRGSDNIGIDITDKIKKIVPDYFTISDTGFTGAVRGEILMSFPEFDKFSATRENAENARNSTSGLMGMKEVSEDLKYLSLIVYTVIGIEYTQTPAFYDYISMHNWLVNNYGIDNVVPISEITYSNDAQFMEDMNSTRDAWYNKYPADGIVITLNNINFVKSAVEYNAIAFKFPAETKETTIVDIEWNLSKTKYLVPTIIVEPVRLSGATVSRAAGCNAKRVLDMKWGIGAKIKITRSGEVIPYIESTVIPATPELPTTCPSCNSELVWDGVHLRCPNPECRDIQIQDLLVWCNNIAPIDGLGDTLKLKFFEEFEIKSIEDIYNPSTTVIFVARGAQKSLFADMVNSLKTKKVSMVSALKALNIPRLGDATANSLSHYPDDIEKLINGVIPDNFVQKIGDANSRSIITHIDKFSRLNYIKDNLVFNEEISNNLRIPVAITGSLSIPRKQFETLINEKGFVVSSITKDTKYLITDNPDSGSSKNAKADKLGIEKITEADFRQRFNI
jgi:DNA ligase (NAD+)